MSSTNRRTVRIDDELWAASLAAASENDENLSDVIREALRAYVHNHWAWGMNQSGRQSQEVKP